LVKLKGTLKQSNIFCSLNKFKLVFLEFFKTFGAKDA